MAWHGCLKAGAGGPLNAFESNLINSPIAANPKAVQGTCPVLLPGRPSKQQPGPAWKLINGPHRATVQAVFVCACEGGEYMWRVRVPGRGRRRVWPVSSTALLPYILRWSLTEPGNWLTSRKLQILLSLKPAALGQGHV